jgi:site-specific DNA recombinase
VPPSGIQIYVTSNDALYDLSKPKQWQTLANDGIHNAYTSEKTSLRMKRDADAQAEAGRPHGQVLYGYKRVYDPETKELVEQCPHPDHAPVVKDIISSVYKGESLTSIARRLNDGRLNDRDGIRPLIPSPRGAKWSMRTVRRVALNQGYIGLRGHNGHTTKGIWPPLVDETVFYGARRILMDPKRINTRPGRAKWLASLIASCALCEGPMVVVRRGENRTVTSASTTAIVRSNANKWMNTSPIWWSRGCPGRTPIRTSLVTPMRRPWWRWGPRKRVCAPSWTATPTMPPKAESTGCSRAK